MLNKDNNLIPILILKLYLNSILYIIINNVILLDL